MDEVARVEYFYRKKIMDISEEDLIKFLDMKTRGPQQHADDHTSRVQALSAGVFCGPARQWESRRASTCWS